MNIRKSLRQSKQTSLPCNDSEQNTNLGVAVRISITRITWRFNATWSCHQGWNTVETPMFLNWFRSIIRIGSTLSHLHSDAAFSCYLYFHSAWRWLLSYSKILHCLLHSENYWYVQFHSVWWWLLSCRKILHCLPTFRRLLLVCVLPLSLMVIGVLHWDTFYCYLYFPLSLMVIVVLHSDTFYCYLYFH